MSYHEHPGRRGILGLLAASSLTGCTGTVVQAQSTGEPKRVFPSVTGMKAAADLLVGEVVQVLGYYEVGDGGDGCYVVEPDSEAGLEEDGGALIALPSAGVFARGIGDLRRVERWGARGDGVTDDSRAFSSAIAFSGSIELSAKTYLIEELLVQGDGVSIFGRGRGATKIKLTATSQGLVFDNARHCLLSDVTIEGNNLDAPLLTLRSEIGNCSSNVFSNIRFVGNGFGARPEPRNTAHVGVRGLEAPSGISNYFHRFSSCDFDSLFSAFHADYNANAWFVSDLKAQNVWRVFRGGFQEWMVSSVYWHFSAGDLENESVFLELFGPRPDRNAQYNHFSGVVAEPGPGSTFLRLGARSLSNFIEGDHQCDDNGSDLGLHNRQVRSKQGRLETGSDRQWRYSGELAFSSDQITMEAVSGITLNAGGQPIALNNLPSADAAAEGGAAPLPGRPLKYLVLQDESGQFLIPVYRG